MSGGENAPLSPDEETLRAQDAAFLSQLEQYGRLVFSPVGHSMFPMLRGGRDVVVLIKPDDTLSRLDVALYRNAAGRYILHRYMGQTARGLIFWGDALPDVDEPVKRERVLAVMTAFYRGNREISARQALYRAYAHLWCASRGLRRVLIFCTDRAARLWARVKKGIRRG